MGKTKIKTIDDSAKAAEEKPHFVRQSRTSRGKDELVEKLKQELGIEEPQPETGKEVTVAKKVEPSQKRSKKYLEASKDLDKNKSYALSEAIEIIKKISYSKFDGTLEAHINTTQTGLRGLVSLPFVSGKKLRILVFEGDDAVIEQISKNKIDFDIVITTPKWMPKLAKVAKILGPKGLMPNPKNGTITEDVKKAAESFQTGKTEYKTEPKAPVIHLALGKLSQPNEELEVNIKTLLTTIGKTKIKKVVLSPTMGPGIRLDLSSI